MQRSCKQAEGSEKFRDTGRKRMQSTHVMNTHKLKQKLYKDGICKSRAEGVNINMKVKKKNLRTPINAYVEKRVANAHICNSNRFWIYMSVCKHM